MKREELEGIKEALFELADRSLGVTIEDAFAEGLSFRSTPAGKIYESAITEALTPFITEEEAVFDAEPEMTFDEFADFQHTLLEECKGISRTKGKEYARAENRFANFVRMSRDNPKFTPEDIGMIFFNKHLDAIKSYVSTGQVYSEPIRGRFIDAIVYLTLVYGMIEARRLEEDDKTLKGDIKALKDMERSLRADRT